MIDAIHWKRLRDADPQDVAERSLARYDAETGTYHLRLLTDELVIDSSRESVAWADAKQREGKPPAFHQWLVGVVYLLSAQAQPPTGNWVGPNSLPYGEFFFRGPHALPTGLITDAFSERPQQFTEAARALGGRAWQQGRHAFEMPALPRVPILIQFWEKDDEFPARAGFLFDRNACDHLMVDALGSLALIVAKRFVEVGEQ